MNRTRLLAHHLTTRDHADRLVRIERHGKPPLEGELVDAWTTPGAHGFVVAVRLAGHAPIAVCPDHPILNPKETP